MPMSYNDIMSTHLFKQAVIETAKIFDAKVIDVGSETLVFEIVSWSKRVDAFIRMMSPFGIVEAVRSGTIAMNRSAVAGVGTQEEKNTGASIDLSDLPPS